MQMCSSQVRHQHADLVILTSIAHQLAPGWQGIIVGTVPFLDYPKLNGLYLCLLAKKVSPHRAAYNH
jgi:hypothetical protein